MTKTVEKTPTAQKNEQRVWIGPQFKTVIHQRVYLGEVPEELKEVMENCPLAKELLVSLDNYAKALENLKVKGSLQNTAFEQVCKFLERKE